MIGPAIGVAALLLAAGPPAQADGPGPAARREKLAERDRLAAEAIKLRAVDDLRGAIAMQEKALAAGRSAFGAGGEPEAVNWSRLVRWRAEAGDAQGARRLAEEVADARTAAFGKDDWQAAFARRHLLDLDAVAGWDADRLGRFRRSGLLAAQVLLAPEENPPRELLAKAEELESLRRSVWGDEHYEVALSLWKRGRLLLAAGDRDRAGALFERAVDLGRKTLGDRHPYVATALTDLGLFRLSGKDPAGAEAILAEAAAFQERAGQTRTTTAYLVQDALRQVYAARRDTRRAREAAARAEAAAAAALGESSSHHLMSLAALADSLLADHRVDEAVAVLEREAALRRKAGGGLGLILALQKLARAYLGKSDLARTEGVRREILALRAQADGPRSRAAAEAAVDLGLVLVLRQQPADAEPLLRRARPALGAEPSIVAYQCVRLLGQAAAARGNLASARDAYREAVPMGKALFGDRSELHVNDLANLGLVLTELKDYAEAERVLLEEREARRRVYGAKHAEFAFALDHLETVYNLTGLPEKSKALNAEALALRRAALGEKHELTAQSFWRLGGSCVALKQYAEAVTLLRRAVEIHESLGRRKSPAYLSALASLGSAQSGLGEDRAALATYRRAGEAIKAARGESDREYPRMVSAAATEYEALGEYPKAEAEHRRAAALWRASAGEASPEHAAALERVAFAVDAQGRTGEAKGLAAQAVAILEQAPGDHAGALSSALGVYGHTCARLGQFDQALPALRRAVELCRARAGDRDRDTILARWGLAYCRYQQGEPDARRGLTEALESLRAVVGEDDPVYVSYLATASACHRASGDFAAAERGMRRVLELAIRRRGETHPEAIRARLHLANLYVNLRRLDEARRLIDEARGAHERTGGGGVVAAEIDEALGFLTALGPDKSRSPEYYRRALEVRRADQGEGHPAVLAALETLGVRYTALLDYDRAEAVLREALAVCERGAGPGSDAYASVLDLLGELSEMKGDFAAARAQYLRASAIREALAGKASLPYAEGLLKLAGLDVRHGEFARAEATAREALAVFTARVGRTNPRTAAALAALAVVLQARGDAAGAHALLAESSANRLAALGETHPDSIRSLDELGRAEQLAGDPASAERTCRRAYELRKKTLGERHSDVALAGLALALPLMSLGDLKQAGTLLEQARAALANDPGPKSPVYATALTRLATVRMQAGDLLAAEALFRQARDIRRAAPGDQGLDVLETLEMLGALHAATGDLAGAEAAFDEAAGFARSRLGPDNPLAVIPTELFALTLIERGDPKAAPMIAEVERVAALRRSDMPVLTVMAQQLRAYEAEVRGDEVTAAARYAEALTGVEAVLSRASAGYLTALGRLAALRRLAGEFQEARPLARQAVELAETHLGPDHAETARALAGLAAVAAADGRPGEAEPLYRRALEIDRRLLDRTFGGLSERRQLAMTGAYRGVLDGYLALGGAVPAARAYEHVLTWKGSVLARQRAARPGPDRPDLGPLRLEADDAARRLAAMAMTVPEGGTPSERSRTIRELSERLDALGAELARRGGPAEAPPVGVTPGSLSAALPADVALVDLLEYRPEPDAHGPRGRQRRLVAFVSRRGRSVSRVELGTSQAVESALARWRPDAARAPDTDRRAAASELRRQLWEPLATALEGATVVLVSPDGPAARVPFAALPGRAPGSYLIEEHALAAVAVPRSLPALLAGPGPTPAAPVGGLVAVGDVDFDLGPSPAGAPDATPSAGRPVPFPPLPGTADEVVAIAAAWDATGPRFPATVLRRGQAVESALRRQVAQARYLHLATHGFFLPEPPGGAGRGVGALVQALPALQGLAPADAGQLPPTLRSGLALAGANRAPLGLRPAGDTGDDGIWTALEVGGSDLSRVELVVLSACETGLGQSAGGEGLLGLQRAFQAAGARTVLASLWKVNDDATRALMVEFYRNLWTRRLGRLESLRAAQLALLRGTLPAAASGGRDRGVGALVPIARPTPGRLPPAFWAGFVLSGDWR